MRPALLAAFLVALLAACGGSDATTDATSDALADAAANSGAELAPDAPPEASAPAPFDYCEGQPPDAACYSSKRDPGSEQVALAQAIADRYLDLHPGATWAWSWEQAVLGVGFYELYRVTGEARFLDALRAWIDHHREVTYWILNSDTCAPTLSAAFLYMETGEQAYRDVVEDGLHYLDEVATRTPQGGLNHWGASLNATLWVDSLFMFGNLLTRWGEFLPDPARLDEMAQQFRIFTDLLQSEGGFYVHAYNSTKEVDTDIYWGRGNGWVTASGYDYLRARRVRGEADAFVEAALAKQVAAAVNAMDADSGQWWIVLNRPGETYLETSTGALFAYAMARAYRYGFLGDEVLPVIRAAVAGMRAAFTTDDQGRPVVSGVSKGTAAGTLEYYAGIDVADDLGYGVGTAILALLETSGLPTAP